MRRRGRGRGKGREGPFEQRTGNFHSSLSYFLLGSLHVRGSARRRQASALRPSFPNEKRDEQQQQGFFELFSTEMPNDNSPVPHGLTATHSMIVAGRAFFVVRECSATPEQRCSSASTAALRLGASASL